MAGKNVFYEQTICGRQRFIRESNRHGSSKDKKITTRQLLDAAAAREADLIAENNSLQERLSVAQRDQDELQELRVQYENLQVQYHNQQNQYHTSLAHEHHQCRYLTELEMQEMEIRRLEDELDHEKDRRAIVLGTVENLTEELAGRAREMELLRRWIAEREEMIRLMEIRLAEEERRTNTLRGHLRDLGFRVD
jgi:hypothetical protein